MREVAGPLRPHLGLEMSVSSLLGAPVIRPSPPSHATAFLPVRAGGVGIHPQSHAGVVENRQVVLPAVELVVRVRRVGGGDPPWSEYQPSGLAIARVETLRHQVGTAFAGQ